MNKRLNENLLKIKDELNTIIVPDNFNQVVLDCIESKEYRKASFLHSKIRMTLTILTLFILLFMSFSFDSIAFMGRKWMGYENKFDGPVSAMIDNGEGQWIGKSVKMKNGNIVTIDGIVFNENHMYVFTNTYHEDSIWDNRPRISIELQGIHKYYSTSGTHKIIDNHTERGYSVFEVPKFYEKWMVLKISDSETTEKIHFSLNRSEAYVETVKYKLSKIIKGDNFKLNFETINISYEEIYIKGSMSFKSNTDYERIVNENYTSSFHFDLVVDGKTIRPSEWSGGGKTIGNSSDEMTMNFIFSFHNPGDVKNVEIKNIAFGTSIQINQEVVINLNYTDDIAIPNPKFNGISIIDETYNFIINDEIRLSEVKSINDVTTIKINSVNEIIFYLRKDNKVELLDYTVIKEKINNHFVYTITYHNPHEHVHLYLEEIGFFQNINEDIVLLNK